MRAMGSQRGVLCHWGLAYNLSLGLKGQLLPNQYRHVSMPRCAGDGSDSPNRSILTNSPPMITRFG